MPNTTSGNHCTYYLRKKTQRGVSLATVIFIFLSTRRLLPIRSKANDMNVSRLLDRSEIASIRRFSFCRFWQQDAVASLFCSSTCFMFMFRSMRYLPFTVVTKIKTIHPPYLLWWWWWCWWCLEWGSKLCRCLKMLLRFEGSGLKYEILGCNNYDADDYNYEYHCITSSILSLCPFYRIVFFTSPVQPDP